MSWDYQKYLHVYAQHSHHQESFIVGNREALLELRKLIDIALSNGKSVGDFFPSDDEGFQLYVGVVESEDTFNSLEMPYTEQFGEINHNNYFINLKDDPRAPYSPVILFPDNEKEEES
ncbi:hypothetical protein [Virgibacillus sp. SK37]|uniref:hypothetical protein n=1 Tax=Virgibacillus sp. SK37 TaxID=403957 RepID=UPI0011A1BCC4|nr:hypothetical protein [Virgibacillus sp. SK37]